MKFSVQCSKCPNPNYPCWCLLHPGPINNNADDLNTIKAIQKEVAKKYDITVSEMVCKSRDQELVKARQVAMRRCRIETEASLQLIGKQFNRSHSAVLHAIKIKRSVIEE